MLASVMARSPMPVQRLGGLGYHFARLPLVRNWAFLGSLKFRLIIYIFESSFYIYLGSSE